MAELCYPFLNGRSKGILVKQNAFESYFDEPKIMGEAGLHKILDQGLPFSKTLAQTLANGGSAIFPHTYISECGYQIASVVHACLDSGADQIVALGVLHPMNELLLQARTKELNRKDISDELSWGVLSPGKKGDDFLKLEFSLMHFKTLWDVEVKRRGIKAPKLFEFYPSLTNRSPDSLPGIKELADIVRDSCVVATDDMCHHGIAYGVSTEEAVEIGDSAYGFARSTIDTGFAYLAKGDYCRYFDHWMHPHAIGDPTDCATVLRYLLGNASYNVLDLKLVDLSRLFEKDPSPSWVAATLVKMTVDENSHD